MKYEIIESDFKITPSGVRVFRIRAKRSIKSCGVSSGDLGGYIEKESNLDQSGDAWISGNALVSGSAQVSGNALVSGSALVYGSAQVYGDAQVLNRNQSVNVTNLKWSFTSLPKGVQVGCEFHSLKEWKEGHQKIGEKYGLSPGLSKAYYKLMVAVRRIQHLEAKK